MAKKNTKVNEINEANELNVPEVDETDNMNQEEMDVTEALLARVAQLEAELEKAKEDNKVLIKAKASAGAGGERKSQVLTVLKERGPISIKGMASLLGTTTRNISSVLTAIRNTGYVVHTDHAGQKYIVSEPDTTTVA